MAQGKLGANRRTRRAWKCTWSYLSHNVNTGSKLIHEHEHSIWTHTMDSSINHGILIAASPEKMKKWRQIYKANLKSLIFLLAAGSITLASPVLWTHKRSFVEWHDLAASEISLPSQNTTVKNALTLEISLGPSVHGQPHVEPHRSAWPSLGLAVHRLVILAFRVTTKVAYRVHTCNHGQPQSPGWRFICTVYLE